MFIKDNKQTDIAFNNAFNNGSFTKKRANDNDYIMYMCSKYSVDGVLDYFKSKITKTKWTVNNAQ